MSSHESPVQDIYPLTPMQEGMLFHSLSDPGSSTYFDQLSYRLHGQLDADIIEKSLDELFKRYDILRTAFVYEGVDRPLQVVLRKRKVDFYFEDLREKFSAGRAEKEAYIEDFKRKDREKTFDLRKDVLMRVSVFRLDDTEYQFTWSGHHILLDGWCMGILISDYFEIYNSFLQNRSCNLARVTPFRVYIQWLEKQDKDKSKNYWEKYLEFYEEAAGIPKKNTRRSGSDGYQNEQFSFVIEKEKTAALKNLAGRNNVTLNTIIQAVWGIILSKYNGREDVVFGAIVSGRPDEIPGIEAMVGLFINAVPVRIRCPGNKKFNELLQEVRQRAVESEPYHYHSLAEIQAQSVLKQDLLDHILVFENLPIGKQIDGLAVKSKKEKGGVELEPSRLEVFEQTNYDFNMIISPAGRIGIRFAYNGSTYDMDFVQRIASHFSHVINQILLAEEISTAALTLLTAAEKKQILYDFNDTRAEPPTGETLHHLFAQQAEKKPHHIAMVKKSAAGRCALTYGELHKRAGRLAAGLRDKGVNRDKVVGLLVKRSFDVVIGMLAVLRAGGAYLPIDPQYPGERIAYMLEDSEVKQVLTNCEKEAAARAVPAGIEVIDMGGAGLYTGSRPSPANINTEADLAYVIYTSGSTGRPKGVMLEHGSLVNLMRYHHRHTNIDCSAVLQFSTISFDASFHEIFSALLAGGKLLVIDEELRTAIPSLFRLAAENKIKTLFLPISFLKIVFSEDEYIGMFPASVQHIQTAGEQVVISQKFARYLKENNVYLHNHYGPAETHVVTAFTVDPAGEIPELPPIGKPILNTGIYILDREMNIRPIGVPGELYIGGLMVGRGYLGRDDLTAEKFIPNPFKEEDVLYKTGDLAKWLPDGNIDFLGRSDYQVKIRGFRIEPGEVENRLVSHPLVKEAVVVPFERSAYGVKKGEKFLCAYIVAADSGAQGSAQESTAAGGSEGKTAALPAGLREYLAETLPEYMLPSYFIALQEIPLTPNGKLNRRALPEPGVEETGVKHVPPGNDIEEKLVWIWSSVLGIGRDKISIDANFFELGGHSLKAIVLVSRIKKEFNVEFSLHRVFSHTTVRQSAAVIKDAKKTIYDEIKPVEKRDYYPQSSAQKRLFFLDQFEDVGTSYNLPAALHIAGKLDKARYSEVFDALIARHESLRTSFELINSEPVQIVHDRVAFAIEKIRPGSEKITAADFQKIMKSFIRPFDLSRAPLLRVGLVPLGEEEYFLLYDMHHIISDGTSISIMSGEFARLCGGGEPQPLQIQYKDFSIWQKGMIAGGRMKESENFWLEQLRGEIVRLNLPLDYPRPNHISFAGDSYDFKIPGPETARFKEIAANIGATLYMNLLAVLFVLFYKYTGQGDIIIGSGIVDRPHVDLRSIIGMFVNTLAMRAYPEAGKTYLEFLREVKRSGIRAFENQDVQFAELVDKLNPERNPSRNPLFDIFFVLQNFAETGKQEKGVRFVNYKYEDTSKFDITITAYEKSEEIYINMEYCTDLYKRETIERLAGHFINLVRAVNSQPGRLISSLDILSQAERQRLLYDFNDTSTAYPEDKTIPGIFAGQVLKTPDNIAVVAPGFGTGTSGVGAKHSQPEQKGNASPLRSVSVHLTYRELQRQAAVLAQVLVEKGIGPDMPVAMIADRSLEMVTGIMAILQAGGAYLPIEPDSPAKRKSYMLADSGARLLLTTRSQSTEVEKVFIEDRRGEAFAFYPGSECFAPTRVRPTGGTTVGARRAVPSEPAACNLQPVTNPTNLAYLIYTSGSTGKPKGVMVNHNPVVNLLFILSAYYPLKQGDSYLLKTSYLFDVSVTELFGWFLAGGKLVVLQKGAEREPQKISDTVQKEKITHLNFVPSMFNVFLEVLNRENIYKLSTLKYIFLAGEALLPGQVKKFRSFKTGIRLENLYGPTEAAVYASKYALSEWQEDYSVPIGKPLGNVQLYILDKYDGLQAVGIVGELVIAGAGLGRGYLNRPELTAEKFVTAQAAGFNFNRSYTSYRSYYYKTGDLARWLPGGNIEFLGRVDQQVKIRGFRIELEEIRAALMEYPGMEDCVILCCGEDEDKHIAAYIKKKNEIDDQTLQVILKDFLVEFLPGYMVPAYFVFLEQIPLTPGGKVDRKALLSTTAPAFSGKVEYAAPGDELEKKLVEIWSQVLAVEKDKIGIDAVFFEIGGHSLRAMIMAGRVHKELDVRIPLSEFFKAPTIRGTAQYIKKAVPDKFSPIKAVEKRLYYPLSPAQKRLFILRKFEENNIAYNMPVVLYIEEDINKDKLAETFKKLICRHESFRTSFALINEEPVQRVHDQVDFEIEYYERTALLEPATCNSQPVTSTIKRFIRPFDLSRAPLLRVGLAAGEGARPAVLMVDIHHIITDGTSQVLLVRDFAALYSGAAPHPLRLRYTDYSQWLQSPGTKRALAGQEEFWLQEFAAEVPVLNLPTDFPRQPLQSFAGRLVQFELDSQETKKIKEIAHSENATLFMVLLAIYNIFLAKLSGQEDIVVGTATAGRKHTDFEKIIGMFVNTLALRSFPTGEKSFKLFLKEIKEKTIKAFENDAFQFEDLLEKVAVNRDMSRNPLFDVMFVIQNFYDASGAGGIARQEKEESLKIKPYPYEPETAKFDLTLTASEQDERLVFRLEYCSMLFEPQTIKQFISYFKNITAAAAKDPETKINEIEILSEEEKQHILVDFNDTISGYPRDRTIHGLFEDQAGQTPDNIALVFKGMALTYKGLDKRANQVAGFLREKGIAGDNIVGLLLERSTEMIPGMFGILKAGAAYLPLDPSYPDERIGYMIADSGTALLLTLTGFIKKVGTTCEILDLNDSDIYSAENGEAALSGSGPGSPAYVIYTSGSTGKPKGVVIEHRGICNLNGFFKEKFYICKSDKIIQFASISFDASVWEIYMALLNGAALYPLGEEIVSSIEAFAGFLNRHNITAATLPPEYAGYLHPGQLKCLRLLITAGSSPSLELVDRWRKKLVYINAYGPTETTICATFNKVEQGGELRRVSIGRPINNTYIYITDSRMNIRPVGVTGELSIAGVGVGRGYLNRPELTAEKFVKAQAASCNFYRSHTSYKSYLYKTGDLARWLKGGDIEFLGRMDSQVKIRGFRIELGEIQNILTSHDKIKAAVVAAHKEESTAGRDARNMESYLCAYIAADEKLEIAELKDHLSKKLPAYMVPSYFKQVDRIPLTPAGKVDFKVLASSGETLSPAGEYVPPGSEMEKKIAAVWQDILPADRVGIDDNFFDLGGNSLDIIKVNGRLKEISGKDISLVSMFKYPTIRSLTTYISPGEEKNLAAGSDRSEALERGKKDRHIRLEKRKRITKN